MANYLGPKYGDSAQEGTSGGVVTWSIAGAGLTSATSGFLDSATVSMSSVFNFDYESVMRQAFAAWSAVANIEFVQIEDTGEKLGSTNFAEIRLAAADVQTPDAGGVTSYTYKVGSMLYSQVAFESTLGSFWTAQSLYLVALHEIGHALGLDHSSGVTAIMNTTYNASLTGLQSDDITGIKAIYGAQDSTASSYTIKDAHSDMTMRYGIDNFTLNGNYNNNKLTLTDKAETVLGKAGDDTIYAGAGNDTIYGDDSGTATGGISWGSGTYVRSSTDYNDSIANAIDISNLFSIAATTDVSESTTHAHVSITGTGDGTIHYYAVTVGNQDTAIYLDVDDATFDSFVAIYDASGTLVRSNNNAQNVNGEDGASPDTDSYAWYLDTSAQTYYIAIGQASSNAISAISDGGTYTLQVQVVDDIKYASGNDIIEGGSGADKIYGGGGTDWATYTTATAGVSASLANSAVNSGDAGGDTYSSIENLRGSSYADTLTGDTNDNVLEGGAGSDTLSGGAGSDTASYEHATAAVTASLASGGTVGDASGDTYTTIENLKGSAYADTLTGDSSANTLTGGAGSDALNGGGGSDTASYAGSTSAVTVSLATGAGSGGDAAGDTLSSIENITGTDYADTLTGDANGNTLDGGKGHDILIGGAGADILIGGKGNDWASYSNASAAVTVSLASGGTAGDASGDTYSGIENLIGTDYADTLTGDDNRNEIWGGAGNDTLTGGGGNDTLAGGTGSDTLDGGTGDDLVSYATEAAGVVVSLADGGISNSGRATGDLYTSIEGAIGSANNDIFLLSSLPSKIDGGAAFDEVYFTSATSGITYSASTYGVIRNVESIIGSEFADTFAGNGLIREIYGEGGDDTISGASGTDWLSGGSGSDTISYAYAAAAVSVYLANSALNTGDAAEDSFTGFENVKGTAYNDTIYGDANDNTLNGGVGDDVLWGGAGNDTLKGDFGSDLFYSSDGSDSFNGGFTNGTDTINYASEASAATINLGDYGASNSGSAAGDTYFFIENIVGTDYNDTITGNSSANALNGGKGNDTLEGGSGNDSLYGGEGDDTLIVESTSDTVYENAGEGSDTVTSSVISLDLANYSNVENLKLTGSTALYLTGNSSANVLTGNSGSNTITGNGGNDTIDGGAGSDTSVFSGNRADYTISVGANSSLIVADGRSGSPNGTDTLSNIEYLQFADGTISAANWINNLPVGTPTATLASGTEDVAYTVSATTLLTGISDADGDALSVTALTANHGSVTDNGNGTFTITPDASYSGAMTLSYSAQDARGGVLSGLTRSFTIVNINTAPTGVALSASSVAEYSANDTAVGILSALDTDTNDTFTYTLVDNAGGRFAISGDTLVTASRLALDFETASSHTITVSVTDAAGASAQQTFTISVTDVQGETVSGDSTARTIKGGIGNDSFTDGTGTETFAGGVGDDTYSIGNTDTIIENAGEGTDTIKVSGSYALTSTAEIEYLQVKNLTGTGGVTLSGNDYAQYITGNSGDNALNGYGGDDLLKGAVGLDILDGGTGTDTAVYSGARASYSITTTGVYTEVKDNGSGFNEGSDSLKNIEKIQFSDGTYTISQLTNHAPTGSPTGTITAGTEDTAKTISASSLKTGILDSDGDTLSVTNLTASNGTVTTSGSNFIITPTANFNGTMTLTYSIDDGRTGILTGLTRSYTVSAVNDAPSAIALTSQTIAENSTNGTAVATLSAADPDTGNTFTYSLIDNAGGRFAISGANLVVADSSLLDYEQATSHDITIQVKDQSNLTFSKTFTISVDDQNPETVTGTAGANTIVGGYQADTLSGGAGADTLKGQAGNDTLDGGADADTAVYSGNLSDYVISFNEVSSVLTIADMRGGTPDGSDSLKNVESLKFADQTVAASTYINYTPTGSPTAALATIAQSQSLKISSATLLQGISDPDGDAMSVINLFAATSTVTANADGSFTITPAAIFEGQVDVFYQVRDARGLVSLPLNQKFNVVVNHTPTSIALSGASIAENSAAGTVVGSLSATDADSGETFTYALLDSAAGRFSLSNGAIKVANPLLLDYETAQSHDITLRVTDSLGATFDKTITIALSDIANEILSGDDAANTLTGASGNDTIEGGGNDVLAGGAGDDIYVTAGGDTLTEEAGGGIDLVESSFDFVLGDNFENLTLTGAAQAGTGNAAANVITGNAKANTLRGLGAGDSLDGAAGNDTLVGGSGRDMMKGGAGNDLFDFNLVSESGKTTATRDVITDFEHLHDHIDLRTIDANTKLTGNQVFKFIGTQAFHKLAGELHFSQSNVIGTANDKTIVSGDVNGDGKADFMIELTGLKGLTAVDLLL